MMFFGLFRKKQVVEAADFSRQNLREVPANVYEHKRTIQRLYLSKNELRDFPIGILRLEGLTELDLSSNDLLFLPPTIGQFSQLKVLNLSGNNLPNIPDGIQNCEELISLNFNNNPIGRVCEGISMLQQLRHLKLNDCELDTLPPSIGRLGKLETLELRENRLVDLPISFGDLSNLEKLELGSNEFESLPSHIGQLSSLAELWLDSNILLSLPEEIGMLTNLTFFELTENRLIDLPSSFGNLNSLRDLYLSDNLLSELPASFGDLHSLQNCKLNTNRLVGLPDTLTGLHSLVDLDLSHNFIMEVPVSLFLVGSLVSLNLNENQLEKLPEEIGSCSSLTILSLRNNKIVQMPSSLTHLKNLKVLTVVGNRLTRLPLGLLSMDNLKAVWVAENQIRPILEFQTQEDPESNEKWLTCVVFPQTEHRSSCEDSQSFSGSDLTMVVDSQPSLHRHRQQTTVNFDPEAKETKSSISRDLTPFPKELHNKVKQWRKSRDLMDSEGLDKVADSIQLRNHTSPRKLSRPYSLLKALANPVQDSNGIIEASPSRSGTLSPDLLLNLPTSDIVTKKELSTESAENGNPSTTGDHERPLSQTPPSVASDTVSDDQPISVNSNSNNNTYDPSDSLPAGPEDHVTHPCTKPPSIISDSSSVVSTNLSKYLRENETDQDHPDSGQGIPAWYLSPTPSPYHPPERDSSVSIMEKLERENFECLNEFSSTNELVSPPAFVSPIYDTSTPQAMMHGPIELTTVHDGDQEDFSSKSQENASIQHNVLHHNRLNSDPESLVLNKPPLCYSHTVDDLSFRHDNKTQASLHRHWSLRQRQRERDFAIEYTLQSQLRPEVVHSNVNQAAADQMGSDVEHLYNYPRPLTDQTKTSYTNSFRERNTFETSRGGFKSMGSLCDSGIEIRRPTPIGACLARSASTGMGLEMNSSGYSIGTYEITLRKNPTLGMAITGGRDGENAIYPSDKGFHVYRLVDGMPAANCGKIRVGDRIVEVNGVYVNNLTNAQIVKLLTAPESYVTVLFSREPSVTLL